MPGRIAAATTRQRVARQSIVHEKATEQAPDEGADTSLRKTICTIFCDSQRSNAGHRKCVIALRKLQERCCYEPISQKGRQADEFEEADFNREFTRCSLRVLAVKKSEPVADRVVRFIGTFLNTASLKDNELINQEDPDVTSLPETPSSRLVSHLIGILLPLLQSKDKIVRFRATQLTSHIVNSLDSLDDELFHNLRSNLMKRIHDKEAPVRLQAVYGLGRLAAEVDNEDDDDESDSDKDTGAGVLEKLLNILQHDPSAEVRRNLLLNLPLNKDVLPYLLERARDSDNATRRALYARLLPSLGDFRHLSLTHREKLLRWGLRDRDESVRTATARLFRERWIEDCAAVPTTHGEDTTNIDEQAKQQQQQDKVAGPSLDALLELLERIDIINSGADGGIAQIAMREFWQGRPDYVSYLNFPTTFWDELTPELAFVARTFNDHCRSPQSKPAGSKALDVLAEEKLPEVSRFGSLLDREIRALIDSIIEAAAGEDDEADERAAQHEFVVEQMLHMALTFDYSDEVGRRKMFGLMRETLASPELPEEITRLVVETLRLVCGPDSRGEKEFCGVVLEAVAEVHDTIMTDDDADLQDTDLSSIDDSFHSATSHLDQEKASKKGSKKAAEEIALDKEKIIKEIMVNMKCLHIAQCMLQNVACELEDNVHLVTMLNNLIVPAVRSQEAPIRERGLVCLGLCCLLGKNLAQENLTLFQHCFTKGHAALQVIALQIIGDILVTHPSLIISTPQRHQHGDESVNEQDPAELLRQVHKIFSKAIKSSDATVQAMGVTALAKMMLSRLVADADLLKQMVVAYFDPETSSNAQLRQSLTYFLPVYCHSRVDNAARMVSIVCPVLSKLSSMHEAFMEDIAEVEDGDNKMVALTTVANMLVDWTDPRKLQASLDARVEVQADEIHYLLAETVLERLVTTQTSKDERKILCSMLSKLYLPADGCGDELVKTIMELLTEAIDSKVATDASSRNAMSKMRTQLRKHMRDDPSNSQDANTEEATAMESVETEDRLSEHTRQLGLSDASELEKNDSQDRLELRDSTIGIPDAEGTRVVFNEESELLPTDDEETTVE